jgi:hypothetical protein
MLCVDETSQCQAFQRTPSTLPTGFVCVGGVTDEYVLLARV